MDSEKTFRIYLCGGPNCTASGRNKLLKALEDELWAWQLDNDVDLRVSGCQDRCDFAPNMTVWPGPYHYSNLTPEAISQIVEQHLLNGQPVREFLLGKAARR
jgi:NADP-reducing hydrogenase subunit HndC